MNHNFFRFNFLNWVSAAKLRIIKKTNSYINWGSKLKYDYDESDYLFNSKYGN